MSLRSTISIVCPLQLLQKVRLDAAEYWSKRSMSHLQRYVRLSNHSPTVQRLARTVFDHNTLLYWSTTWCARRQSIAGSHYRSNEPATWRQDTVFSSSFIVRRHNTKKQWRPQRGERSCCSYQRDYNSCQYTVVDSRFLLHHVQTESQLIHLLRSTLCIDLPVLPLYDDHLSESFCLQRSMSICKESSILIHTEIFWLKRNRCEHPI